MLLFLNFLLVLSATTHALPFTKRAPLNFIFAGDAPFSVDTAALAAALTCPNGNPTSSSPPVLLVHGTGSTGAESWGEGYVPALLASGYTACYVTLPGRAMGDMQVSSEYIAYSIHYISYLAAGAKTAIISHSQGGPDTQWALQFWPSTRTVTRAFIPLCPDFSGVDLLSSNLSGVCTGTQCQASLWQQAQSSHYYTALHAKNFQAQVPTTSIYTQFDEVVVPSASNAQLPGAKVIAVQQLCLGRTTDHVFMAIDAAGFALALDALSHEGNASVFRTLPQELQVCFQVTAKNMNINVGNQLEALFNDLQDGILLGAPRVSLEPPTMAYAR